MRTCLLNLRLLKIRVKKFVMNQILISAPYLEHVFTCAVARSTGKAVFLGWFFRSFGKTRNKTMYWRTQDPHCPSIGILKLSPKHRPHLCLGIGTVGCWKNHYWLQVLLQARSGTYIHAENRWHRWTLISQLGRTQLGPTLVPVVKAVSRA